MKSKCFDYTMLTLVIIGAIDWGLIGFFKFRSCGFSIWTDDLAFKSNIAIIGLCGLYLISLFGRISGFWEE